MNTYIHFSFFFGLFIIIIPYIAYIYGISIGNDPKERKNIILSLFSLGYSFSYPIADYYYKG